jgi:hypothetical protein
MRDYAYDFGRYQGYANSLDSAKIVKDYLKLHSTDYLPLLIYGIAMQGYLVADDSLMRRCYDNNPEHRSDSHPKFYGVCCERSEFSAYSKVVNETECDMLQESPLIEAISKNLYEHLMYATENYSVTTSWTRAIVAAVIILLGLLMLIIAASCCVLDLLRVSHNTGLPKSKA